MDGLVVSVWVKEPSISSSKSSRSSLSAIILSPRSLQKWAWWIPYLLMTS